MPHATETPTEQWRKLLTGAHRARLSARRIKHAVTELRIKASTSSDDIVSILLGLRFGQVYDLDPLVSRYAELLMDSRAIYPSSFLLGMLQISFIQNRKILAPPDLVPRSTFEEKGFRLVTKVLSTRIYPGSVWKFHALIFAITRWLHVVSEHEVSQQIELGALHTITPTMVSMYEALAVLAYTIFGHENFKEIERQPWWKTRRSVIVDELVKFDVNVLQMCHSQLAGHLQPLTKARPFIETNKDGKPIMTLDIAFSLVEDMPVARSRSGLFVWLTSVLYAQPWLDDSAIRNYILVRYHDDVQTAAIGLVLAAFDVLANSTLGQGTPQIQKRVRSFICDRLPLLLSSLITAMPASGMDNCISMALVSVEVGPISPLGSATAESKEIIKKSKLQFLQSSVLHNVISETTAVSLLSDQPFKALKVQRYSKSNLYNQCMTNISRLDTIIQELETSGNSVAIAKCVAEVLASLCTNKDTVTLKTACSILLRRQSLMDQIFQHVAPAQITLPICRLLDDWTHDQDQTEYQPPYEEFALVLLLLFTIVYSQNLSRADLRLDNNEDFAAKILFTSIGNLATSDLNDEQNKQLSNWIQGLYATDENGETIGITDEVYSQCPPQAFYLLVPILFEQTVLACRSKALDINALKGGLDFLLEPFLLPSLIGGLTWVAETTWTDAEDASIRLTILDKLMRSSSTSQDVQTMHKAILGVVAKPLEMSLQALAETRPEKKKEASKLLDLLKPHLSQSRPLGQNTQAQLTAWTSADNDFGASIHGSLSDVLAWENNVTSGGGSKYTPCIVWAASKVLGPKKALETLVLEIRQQTDSGNASTVLDLCTAIVCAPTLRFGSPTQGAVNVNQLSLVDHMRLLISDVDVLFKLPAKTAQALVRLSRSVEAQAAVSPLASQLDLVNLSMPADAADQVMQDLGLAADNAALDATAAAVISSGLDDNFDSNAFGLTNESTLDLSKDVSADLTNSSLMDIDQGNIFGLDMNLGQTNGLLDGSDANQHLDPNAEDDIFAGLELIDNDAYDFT